MTPRFSILLPTRNGGPFIADCIHSALQQDFDSFELVVSDNANEDATPDILKRVADPRMKVVRQPLVLPVHENWGATLALAAGDYFLMLGDDDYLMPGALKRLDSALLAAGNPDCMLINGYSYVAPRSINDDTASYWARFHHRYDASFVAGELSSGQRASIVRDMFRFRPRIPLNMQTTIFSRRAISHLVPPVFREPFPDHYLLNALLISSGRWVYLPERLVIVGVSPKSFGHYFYGAQSGDGLKYLGIETRAENMLPGNELLNGMYRWLLELKRNFPAELHGIEIARSAYLIRQIRFWLVQYRNKAISAATFRQRLGLLTAADWASLPAAICDVEVWRRIGRAISPRRGGRVHALWSGLERLPDIAGIRAFADWLTTPKGRSAAQ
jgi:glycosyltransferase involved in cell wall biosynthesis